MTLNISSEKMAAYRAGYKKRQGVLFDMPRKFSVDLVAVENAPERTCCTIETEGIVL